MYTSFCLVIGAICIPWTLTVYQALPPRPNRELSVSVMKTHSFVLLEEDTQLAKESQ